MDVIRPMMEIRQAVPDDIPTLVTLWHNGWMDAYAGIVPEELTRMRTQAAFRDRLAQDITAFRVAGPVGAPMALHLTKKAELNQFFVAAEARGTGLAQRVLEDAETRIASAGADTAWLACAIGNSRAARFYEKGGWHLEREDEVQLSGLTDPFPLVAWIFEKRLRPHRP